MHKNEQLKNTISRLAAIYVLFLFIVFPLFVTDKYFNMLNDKFYLFWVSCGVVVGTAIIIGLLYAFSGADKDHGRGIKAFFREFLPVNWKKHLRLPDWFFASFMLVNILSTLLSEYPYEAFWGQYGRYHGLFMWIFYGALYILVSRFYKAKKWHMDVFLAVGVILCLWGITDYLGFDIFGWRAAIDDPIKRYDFSSSIGNVNSLTLIQALYLSVSAVLFIAEDTDTTKGRIRKLYYGAVIFIVSMAITMAASDNALLAIAALLYFLPFYAFKDRKGVISYIGVWALFLLALYATGTATAYIQEFNAENAAAGGSFAFDLLLEYKWGVLLDLANKQQELVTALIATIFFIGAFYYILSFSAYRRLYGKRLDSKDYSFESYLSEPTGYTSRIIWALLGIAVAAGVIYIFIDANTGGHAERYQAYENILIFNDRWGTNRGYNWRLLAGYFADFSLIKKLIGAGPETYGVYTSIYDYYNMLELVQETYDSPHNEVLQYLFSLGILGCLSYYMGVITVILTGIFGKLKRIRISIHKASASEDGTSFKLKKEIKLIDQKPEDTAISAACAFAVLAFTAASVIAISAPTVTPIVILLIAICVGETYGNSI